MVLQPFHMRNRSTWCVLFVLLSHKEVKKCRARIILSTTHNLYFRVHAHFSKYHEGDTEDEADSTAQHNEKNLSQDWSVDSLSSMRIMVLTGSSAVSWTLRSCHRRLSGNSFDQRVMPAQLELLTLRYSLMSTWLTACTQGLVVQNRVQTWRGKPYF